MKNKKAVKKKWRSPKITEHKLAKMGKVAYSSLWDCDNPASSCMSDAGGPEC